MSGFRKAAAAFFAGLSSEGVLWPATILLVYFGVRLVFFAVTISPSVPPDEVTHFACSRIFSEVYFLPENSPITYEYGLVTNIPYLYYWLMGRLLPLNFFGISDLLFLRLLNIPIAFATIMFVWRTLRLLTTDRLTQILLIVAMTNTLMFSFLSASVSYDNLANLLAAMAVYYLLAFFRTRSGDLLAASLLCQLAGSLTKITFLPLALVLNIILFVHEFGNLRLLPGLLKTYFLEVRWRRSGLMFGVLLGLVLNIQLYGGNYLYYGTLWPDMFAVLSPEKAMQHRTDARNKIFSLFKEGQISRQEALTLALQISHPGDRRDTIGLIQNYAYLKDNGIELLGPLAYMAFWVRQMSGGAFGIIGHISMLNRGPTLWPFAAVAVMTGLSLLVRWRPSDAAWLPSCLMVISVTYSLFLMCGVNYRDYLYYGDPGIAVQGRYIFPVLGPIYVLSSYYLLRLFRGGYARTALFTAVSIVFIASDFPYFLLHAAPGWFAPIFL